ncbi:hypothetical protein WCT96_01280 [Pectobacterium carotovorum]|uniref:hypothetical protein n=1 Tax=Pectobacterium TaxID=122277 RepID=UPI001F08561C|nr:MULTISPECIES: hypothetical protein [Pectobacterium]
MARFTGQLRPADTVVCFANTGKEVEATLRFVRDSACKSIDIISPSMGDAESR